MMTDELVKQVLLLFISIAGVLGVGAGARRMLSRDSRDRAKNATEEDYFATALGKAEADRDAWRKSAEDAWAYARSMEREKNKAQHESRNWHFALSAQRKMVLNRCPELAPYLPSEPAPFDDEPHTKDPP